MKATEITLEYGKAHKPCTYKQVEYAISLGLEIGVSTSQVIKRLERAEMSEIIDRLKSGEKIKIK